MSGHLDLGRLLFVVCLLGAELAVAGLAQEATWVEVAKLVAEDVTGGDELGVSVALSGETAVVGAWLDDDLGGSSGAAYVFERHAGGTDVWGQVAKLLAPDGTSLDRFGSEVAIDRDTVVVGAPQDGVSTDGFAWVFERDAGGPGAWGPVQKLIGSDGNFGSGVAIDGETVAIGSSAADAVFLFGPSGAVDVFRRTSAGSEARSWLRVDNLRPPAGCRDDSTACGIHDSSFGASVALDGGLLLVGQSNLVGAHSYAFQRLPSGFWARVARSLPASDDNHNDGDQFALAVAVSGETLLMGAHSDDEAGAQSGSVYVFEPDPGGPERWREAAELHSPDPGEGDRLGFSVDLDGDTAVAGATRGTSTLPGSAWVFERDAGGPGAWGAVAELTASDGVDGNDFGWSIAVDGDTVIVGATDADNRAGAAYVFQEVAGAPIAPIATAARLDAGAHLGASVGSARRDLPRSPRAERSAGWPGRAGAPRLCFELLYCDGLDLVLDGDRIRGWWRNTDCAGTDVPVRGRMTATHAVVGCDPAEDPCPLGSKWNWIFDGSLDGTFDMHRFEETNWNLWLDEVEYTVVPGPCPF